MKNTKKTALLLIVLLIANAGFAQMLEPVKWAFSAKKTSDTEAEVIFTATMDKGWHLYSQYVPAGGPVATEFKLEKNKNFQTSGKVIEPKPIEENDPNFDMVVKYFAKKAVFTQKIKILTTNDFKIKGSVYFMCCNDVNCLPPNEVLFEVSIKGSDAAKDTANKDSLQAEVVNTDSSQQQPVDTTQAVITSTQDDYKEMSLWGFFIAAFLGGLLALLTPCIYPMIPMTISFFMHSQKNRRKAVMQAIFYGISIIFIFLLIGVVVSLTMGEEFANWLSTHWVPNIFFFLIFLVFAASFFGMFEITLPSWLINRSEKQADKGGFLGSFFMAFTLVLVSFSCTAPIAGAILAFSTQGMVLFPVIGMLGYSLAFAIPFTLFAVFPNMLKSLPKSGGWLNAVKVVLGFVELALGLKFLSQADLAYHWGILDREIYLAFWIVIFGLMGFYLLGKLKFSHDSDMPFLKVPRLILAIATFTFVIYLIPGMFGAPLKALSGWIPPMSTHDFDLHKVVHDETRAVMEEMKAFSISMSGNDDNCEAPKYADKLHLPHNLQGYFDLDQALSCAKKLNKPVFIDFTGHSCANCRKMEENVWVDPGILQLLRNDYIIVSLYVDDKEVILPENEWYTSKTDGKLKKTLGEKNFDLQVSKYNSNGQPYYVLTDTDGNMLVKPWPGYKPDVPAFRDWLEKGLEAFNSKSK